MQRRSRLLFLLPLAGAGIQRTLFLDVEKTQPATNQKLVQRLAHLAAASGREIATPDEARAIIGLPPRAGSTPEVSFINKS